MTEQVETFLRTQFETESGEATVLTAGDLGGFARTARGRVRARRRRAALVTGSAVLAVAAVVPFAVLASGGRPGAVPPAGSGQSPSVSRPAGPAADGVLAFRGITVAVTPTMLEPGNRRCGQSLVDAAWWQDEYTDTRSCLIDIPTGGLTEVELRGDRSTKKKKLSSTPSRTTLEDGRTRIVLGFPERSTVLVVTSPRASKAQAMIDSVRVIPAAGEYEGCPVADPRPRYRVPKGARVDGRAWLRQLPAHPVGGRVCGYRDFWLVGTGRLDAPTAASLVASIRVLHSPRLMCLAFDPPQFGGWEVEIVREDGSLFKLRVDPGCGPQLWGPGFNLLVENLRPVVEQLAGLAEGAAGSW
jgi:hypothetical protein